MQTVCLMRCWLRVHLSVNRATLDQVFAKSCCARWLSIPQFGARAKCTCVQYIFALKGCLASARENCGAALCKHSLRVQASQSSRNMRFYDRQLLTHKNNKKELKQNTLL
jgi:hypothetical protein